MRRWHNLCEVLIPKKKYAFINKFRDLTLVEGDIQYLMKAVWSQTLMRYITLILHPKTKPNVIRGKVTQSSVLSHRIDLDTMVVDSE